MADNARKSNGKAAPEDPQKKALKKATGISPAPPAEFEGARSALDTMTQGALGFMGLGDQNNRANLGGQMASAAIPVVGGMVDAKGALQQLVGTAAKPIARFLGWQRGLPEEGIPHVPLYNVEGPGHPLHGSTVSPAALQAHGIEVPTPPAPRWEQPVYNNQGLEVPHAYFNQGLPTQAPRPQSADAYQTLMSRFGGRGK